MLEVEGNIPYNVKDTDLWVPTKDDIDIDIFLNYISNLITGKIGNGCRPVSVDHTMESHHVKHSGSQDHAILKKIKEENTQESQSASATSSPGEDEEKEEPEDHVPVVDGASKMAILSCIRAKMKHFKAHTGAFKRKPKVFKNLVRFDFIDTKRITEYNGSRICF